MGPDILHRWAPLLLFTVDNFAFHLPCRTQHYLHTVPCSSTCVVKREGADEGGWEGLRIQVSDQSGSLWCTPVLSPAQLIFPLLLMMQLNFALGSHWMLCWWVVNQVFPGQGESIVQNGRSYSMEGQASFVRNFRHRITKAHWRA